MASVDDLITVEEAQERIRENVSPLGKVKVALEESYGRILAEDVVSDMDVSPFDNTAMDGFAIRRADVANATDEAPVTLEVVAEIGAGASYDFELQPGQAVRIMTGAPIPEGADAVVKYEDVEGGERPGDSVTFRKPAKERENIRNAGEEFKAGDVVLKAGERINPYAMGMLASAGATEVTVYRKPVVGVFAIGSEIVDPGERPQRGQIRNSNTACMVGLVNASGCTCKVYPIVVDDREAIRAAVLRAAEECDVVVTTGGASKGDFDFINPVIAELGDVIFSYISLRPGKRQTLGVVNGKPVYGLSGNPAAAAVGFELLVRPALMICQGVSDAARPVVRARLTKDVKKKEPRRYYERGLVETDAEGNIVATTLRAQSSALLGALHRCNCLIVLPDGNLGMKAGDEVDCLRIDLPEGTVL